MKVCSFPGCSNPCFGGGYCKFHQYKRTDKAPKKIRMFSEKRTQVNRNEYGPASREFVAKHPSCAIKSPVCTVKSTCVNHRKGRDTIEMLLDQDWWEASCSECNIYIESHDAWARLRGHKVSKHAK